MRRAYKMPPCSLACYDIPQNNDLVLSTLAFSPLFSQIPQGGDDVQLGWLPLRGRELSCSFDIFRVRMRPEAGSCLPV